MIRLKTNRDIESKLLQFCGSSRFLWNKSLAMNLERLEKGQSLLWYQELAWWLAPRPTILGNAAAGDQQVRMGMVL